MNRDNTPIRVIIIDDHDMLREGVSMFIHSYDDLELVGEASSGEEGVRLCKELKQDVALVDLFMPEMDGNTAIKLIHQENPEIRIIVLSSFGEEKLIKEALQNGATSYLLKNVSAAKLASAIRATVSGLPTLAPEIAQALLDTDAIKSDNRDDVMNTLTQREMEVLELIAKGMSNAEIALRLNISIFTAKNHVSNLLSKLRVNSRAEAIALHLSRQ